MENYKKEKWHRHMGVYGICVSSDNELLLIKKNGGPYTGFYDLPGGSLENSESLVEGLEREILEETGYEIEVEKNWGCYDFLINDAYNGCKYTQHIAIMYKVKAIKKTESIIEEMVINNSSLDENDSLGVVWVHISHISINNSSPLVLKACQIINSESTFEMEKYLDWVK